jgi:hypothetical protein
MLMLGYDLKIAIFIYIFVSISMHGRCHSFEIRLGGSARDPSELALEPGRVKEKIGKVMT